VSIEACPVFPRSEASPLSAARHVAGVPRASEVLQASRLTENESFARGPPREDASRSAVFCRAIDPTAFRNQRHGCPNSCGQHLDPRPPRIEGQEVKVDGADRRRLLTSPCVVRRPWAPSVRWPRPHSGFACRQRPVARRRSSGLLRASSAEPRASEKLPEFRRASHRRGAFARSWRAPRGRPSRAM